jgi:outer membrane phospholipase A
MTRTLPSLALLLSIFCTPLHAQDPFILFNNDGQRARLTDLDRQFIQNRMDQLDLQGCTSDLLGEIPRNDYRELQLDHEGEIMHLVVQPDVMRTRVVLLYTEKDGVLTEHNRCDTTAILPVLAIMATAVVAEETEPSRTRLNVLARNSYLTSHEPSRLLARTDSDDDSRLYMDFNLSFKHPVLPRAALINKTYDSFTELAEALIPGNDDYFMQMYFAFSGRFSQYIGSRNSAPVVARRFNPSLFWRFWTSDDTWLDLGLAHESNGQRVNNEESFLREQQNYVNSGEPAVYARDSLSRGWDYSFLTWRNTLSSRLSSSLQLRHYMSGGPLQSGSEEYNLWEDNGVTPRPRRRYSGVEFDLQYEFDRSNCSLGSSYVCLQKLAISQETGYSGLFDHNTTTLELTTDFFGLPIQLWGRSGYNSDLVDYYRYSNSWGIGIELISR